MKIAWAVLFFLLFGVNAFGQAPQPSAQLFDYDAHSAIDVIEKSKEVVEGASVYDLSFASPKGGRVTSYLVVPPGSGPFAAILYVHWGQGDRTEFLSEAVGMAKRGVVSLLIDGPFARPDSDPEANFLHPEKDRQQWIKGVVEMRRAIDVLLARKEVNPKRIGYVGHSYGATFGGVLAGIERRIKAYVLVGGLPGFTIFDDPVLGPFMKSFTAEQKQKYAEAIKPIEPIRFVGNSSPARLLFQFARHDRFISRQAAKQFYETAGQPKEEKWYYCSHEFNDPESRSDRIEWISQQLGVRRYSPQKK